MIALAYRSSIFDGWWQNVGAIYVQILHWSFRIGSFSKRDSEHSEESIVVFFWWNLSFRNRKKRKLFLINFAGINGINSARRLTFFFKIDNGYMQYALGIDKNKPRSIILCRVSTVIDFYHRNRPSEWSWSILPSSLGERSRSPSWFKYMLRANSIRPYENWIPFCW